MAHTGSVDSTLAELGKSVVEVCSFVLLTESSLADECRANAAGLGGLSVTGGDSGSGEGCWIPVGDSGGVEGCWTPLGDSGGGEGSRIPVGDSGGGVGT